MKKHWIAITIVYMGLLLLVSLKPVVETAAPPSALKETLHNLLHVPAYAILAFLLFYALISLRSTLRQSVEGQAVHGPQSTVLWTVDGRPSAKASKGRLWTAFLIAVIYGALMEYLQGFVPGRLPSVLDLILNTLGAGGMVFWLKGRKISL